MLEEINKKLKEISNTGKDLILKEWYKGVKTNHPLREDLPKVFVVDIDGTIAHSEGLRYIYDDNVHVDQPDHAIMEILKTSSIPFIIVSGRQASPLCKENTLTWLKTHLPKEPLAIYMRAFKDQRSDVIIKREIYEKHLKDKYTIVAVFDDRPCVCRMWEEQGVKVLRCGPGYEF